MTIEGIKNYIGNLAQEKPRHARVVIRHLNQTDRKILKKILKGKEAPTYGEIKQLSERLEALKSKDITKLNKTSKPWTHGIKNLFFGRMGSKDLINRLEKMPKQVKTAKEDLQAKVSNKEVLKDYPKLSSSESENIIRIDPRTVLSQELLYKIIADVPIQSNLSNFIDGTVKRCVRPYINMMKVLWRPLSGNDEPKVMGIDAKLLAKWAFQYNIPFSSVFSSEDSKRIGKLLNGQIKLEHQQLEYKQDIEEINLSEYKDLSDEKLKRILANKPNLKNLDLSGCNAITNAGLECLGNLTTLTSLSLRGCDQITDEGLKPLGKLNNLIHLDLSYCPITDKGVMFLNSKVIKFINVYRCLHVGASGFNYLRGLNPDIDIDYA